MLNNAHTQEVKHEDHLSGGFYPFSDGSGGYTVEFPDLPGCITEGRNLEEAFEMATDAASGWVLEELEEGNQYRKHLTIQK